MEEIVGGIMVFSLILFVISFIVVVVSVLSGEDAKKAVLVCLGALVVILLIGFSICA